ncbi:MAG: TldD/PmbA family protein, partial [Acidimicrobiales bacterium]|nr:TldD/PmbA family protein [Acidimicrobiales bacterium]
VGLLGDWSRRLLDADALSELRDAALSGARALGCTDAEIRVERIRSQRVALRDGHLESAVDDTELGMGVRVVHEGALGFAATVATTPDSAADLARRSVEVARAVARASGRSVELAPVEDLGVVRWASDYEVDPTEVDLSDKVGLLGDWSRRLLDADGIDHATAAVLAVCEDKYLATLTGTEATQRRVRVHPVAEAVALDGDGGFETMRTLAPPVGRGWEYLHGTGWDWDAELAALPDLLAEKLRAPSIEPGRYDLVIDPTNLWLTIHESIGHATELDRAMGYEAAYAGTSFATFDRLGTLPYGSGVMHVTGDRTTAHGLATVAVDDEGAPAAHFDLVRDGILVGYQLDRSIAATSGVGASNGCAFADSPLHVPIQRMANVSLASAPGHEPTTADLIGGVEDGLYILGDKSWSIDMQRYNFQFTGQRFFRILGGRLSGQVKDVAYQATTTDFWGALESVGGQSTYLLGGAFNCGKGQPGQAAPVSHGCPSVLVRGINVLNTREESGRGA